MDNVKNLGMKHCALSEKTGCLVSNKTFNVINVEKSNCSLSRDKDSTKSETN